MRGKQKREQRREENTSKRDRRENYCERDRRRWLMKRRED